MKSKPYNGGQWSRAKYISFIKNGLRSTSTKWPPKHKVVKDARLRRGIYRCAGYGNGPHEVPASVQRKGKRVKNIFADHIEPVVNPTEGFVDWNEFVNRLFVEEEGFQVLCRDCHDRKTKDEWQLRRQSKTMWPKKEEPTHCPKGHEMVGDNVLEYKDKRRDLKTTYKRCRTCNNERNKKWREKQKIKK